MAKRMGSTSMELSDAYWRVQYLFFDRPSEAWGLSDLAEALSMHKNTAREAVKLLESEGFLLIEEIGRAWRIRTDIKHKYHLMRKVPYHLQLIYESGVVDEARQQFPGARAIILFGSYRKGDDVEGSDVDIAIEVADSEPLEIIQLGRIERLGFRKDVLVNAHIFDRGHINLNLFANVANGILLDGFLEAHP